MKISIILFIVFWNMQTVRGCNHTLRITDTYGDGWNGGIVKVQVNGVDVLTNIGGALADAGPLDYSFSANQGDNITVILTTTGSYAYERRVEIIDGVGITVLSPIEPTVGGVSTTANCTVPIAPGGVYTGLQSWVKANSGITGTTPITAVANQMASGSGLSINGSPNLDNTSTTYNYNPYINFTGPVATLSDGRAATRQFLYLTAYSGMNGLDYVALFWTGHMTDLTRTNTHLATVDNVTNGSPGNGTMHGTVVGGAAAIMESGYDATDFGASAAAGTWQRNGTNVSYNALHTSTKQILSARCTSGGSTTLNSFFGGQRDQVDPNSFAGHPRDWKGPAAELIGYTSTITATERQKIHSYLAIKYGITLSENYLSTSGSTIFTTAASYNNNIIGIGRDDAEALYQKQSHANDDSVRVYINTLAATNSANAGTFSSDISYATMGANTGLLKATTASNAEVPAGCSLYSRLEREWKITRTNCADNINLNVKLASNGSPGSVTVSHLRLLVDDDGNFANGGTTCYYNGDGTGITFTYSNPLITVTGISTTHFANNGTSYFTIGSSNSATPLPIELLSFTGEKKDGYNELKWSTSTELNNDYFTLEKTIDGSNYSELGIVDGAGNSTEIRNYSMLDVSPSNEINYYRLKQTDFNGEFSYSSIVSINNRISDNNKEISFMTNILGQEVNEYYRGLIVIYYSDGSILKIIR